MANVIEVLIQALDQTDKAFSGAVAGLDKMQRSMQSVAMQAGLASAAMVGVFAAVVEPAVHAAAELEKVSNRTGIATDKLSLLKVAAEQNETTFEELSVGLRFLERALVMSTDQSTAQASVLRQLGIATRDPYEALLQLSEALKNAKDDTTVSTIAFTMFGRAGLNMVPMLRLGREGIEQYAKTAQAFGVIIGPEQGARAHEFEQAQGRIGMAIRGAQNVIMAQMLPALIYYANAISGGIKALNDWAKAHPEVARQIERVVLIMLAAGGFLAAVALSAQVVSFLAGGVSVLAKTLLLVPGTLVKVVDGLNKMSPAMQALSLKMLGVVATILAAAVAVETVRAAQERWTGATEQQRRSALAEKYLSPETMAAAGIAPSGISTSFSPQDVLNKFVRDLGSIKAAIAPIVSGISDAIFGPLGQQLDKWSASVKGLQLPTGRGTGLTEADLDKMKQQGATAEEVIAIIQRKAEAENWSADQTVAALERASRAYQKNKDDVDRFTLAIRETRDKEFEANEKRIDATIAAQEREAEALQAPIRRIIDAMQDQYQTGELSADEYVAALLRAVTEYAVNADTIALIYQRVTDANNAENKKRIADDKAASEEEVRLAQERAVRLEQFEQDYADFLDAQRAREFEKQVAAGKVGLTQQAEHWAAVEQLAEAAAERLTEYLQTLVEQGVDPETLAKVLAMLKQAEAAADAAGARLGAIKTPFQTAIENIQQSAGQLLTDVLTTGAKVSDVLIMVGRNMAAMWGQVITKMIQNGGNFQTAMLDVFGKTASGALNMANVAFAAFGLFAGMMGKKKQAQAQAAAERAKAEEEARKLAEDLRQLQLAGFSLVRSTQDALGTLGSFFSQADEGSRRWADRMLQVLSKLRDTVKAALGDAFKYENLVDAMTSWDAFVASLRQRVFEQIRDGIVEALTRTTLYQRALAPIMQLLSDALEQATKTGTLDLDALRAALAPAVANFNALMASMEPVFQTAYDLLKSSFGGLGGTLTTVAQAGGGTNVTVNFNGPIMGDQSQARQFVKTIAPLLTEEINRGAVAPWTSERER